MTRPALLAAAILAAGCSHLKKVSREVRAGEPFAFESMAVAAPAGPGWKATLTATAEGREVDFNRAEGSRTQTAWAVDLARDSRGTSPEAFLEQVRRETRQLLAPWGARATEERYQ